jgi:hypothetical protein
MVGEGGERVAGGLRQSKHVNFYVEVTTCQMVTLHNILNHGETESTYIQKLSPRTQTGTTVLSIMLKSVHSLAAIAGTTA